MRVLTLAIIAVCVTASGRSAFADARGTSNIATAHVPNAAADKAGNQEITSGRTEGLSIAIVQNGLVTYANGFGWANAGSRLRANANTVYPIGSVSKQMTAAAILILQQDDKLNVDDKLSKYIPVKQFALANKVTLRQLLNQRSGMPYYGIPPNTDPTKYYPMKTMLKAVAKAGLGFTPGSKYQYDNFNYFLLGMVVAKVSDMSYPDFMRERVWEPLGMTHTTYYTWPRQSDRAIGYHGHPHALTPETPWNVSWLLGAGATVSNVYDIAKWDNGLSKILNETSQDQMFKFIPEGDQGASNTGYAMGWVGQQYLGHRYVWHNGGIGGFESHNATLPDQHIQAIVLANVDAETTDLTNDSAVAQELLSVALAPATSPIPASVTKRGQEILEQIAAHKLEPKDFTPSMLSLIKPSFETFVKSLGKPLLVMPYSMRVTGNTREGKWILTYPSGSFWYDLSQNVSDDKVSGLTLG